MVVRVAGLEVRAAERGEAAPIARVLAGAFHDDPVFAWFLPAVGSRRRRLRRFFLTELRHSSLRHGAVEVACVDGRIAGVAVWFPPGTWPPTGSGVSALPGVLWAFGRRLVVAGQFQSAAISACPRDERQWYLAFIGVDSARRGQGIGAALLRSRLRRCDQQGQPAYLESSNPENVPLYEHFGFQVTGTLPLPQEAPVVHAMRRPGDSSAS